MIDEAIETHLRALLSTAYPDVEDDQIIFRFPMATLEAAQSRRGDAIGAERLTVHIIVKDRDKLDRVAFIRLLARQRITLDGRSAEQKYLRTEQKDFIEIVKTKGVIFYVQYFYDIT